MPDQTVPRDRGKHSKPDVPTTPDPERTDRYPEVQKIVDQWFPKEA